MMALARHRRDLFVKPVWFCSAAAMLISVFGGHAYAQAPCTQWDVSGDWTAKQGRFRIKFNLQQTGQNLQGYASLAGGEGSANGPADGQIIGDKFEVTVFWNTIQRSDSIGVYRGQIGPTGRIQGWTQDKTNPGSSAAWHSEERMTCLAREQPSTPLRIANCASEKGQGARQEEECREDRPQRRRCVDGKWRRCRSRQQAELQVRLCLASGKARRSRLRNASGPQSRGDGKPERAVTGRSARSIRSVKLHRGLCVARRIRWRRSLCDARSSGHGKAGKPVSKCKPCWRIGRTVHCVEN